MDFIWRYCNGLDKDSRSPRLRSVTDRLLLKDVSASLNMKEEYGYRLKAAGQG